MIAVDRAIRLPGERGRVRRRRADRGRVAAPVSKAELDRAFSELYKTHLRDVYSYAYYRVGNHHDAEDLTEQAFLQAYGTSSAPGASPTGARCGRGSFGSRTTSPPTTTATVRGAPWRTSRRSSRRRIPHETERVVEGREELREVLDKLGDLSDDRREALIMRFALGMSNREIARALGRSDGATKVLIHRAIKQLEELMADD